MHHLLQRRIPLLLYGAIQITRSRQPDELNHLSTFII